MKYVIFLGDGMADEPIESLGGRTPLQAADTPNLDRLARRGARFGTFLSLPDGFPTSSDVANLSVLGYDLNDAYHGRGPLEAASQGIVLADDEIAMRCNLVTVTDDGILLDYSGGQIRGAEAEALVEALDHEFGTPTIRFRKGVSYRNLLILKGLEYSSDFRYEKPDDHPGDPYADLLPKPGTPESAHTAELVRVLMLNSINLLSDHPVNKARAARGESPANMAWLWSAGRKPRMKSFEEAYGKTGSIVTAVGVIKGIGILGGLDVLEVEGATGYIDTNYEGKARAGVEALRDHDFVYVHVEAIDEVSHDGKLDLKLQAIEDFDKRLIGTFLEEFGDLDNLTIGVLPDHPVPVELRRHTRTPVPVMISRAGRESDPGGLLYNEIDALKGSLGAMRGDGAMRALFAD
ncbi:cofactor-independent phosphoglycerate mutase [Candidatus Sumerlaeota bacterium]|nr:cofactor-independent phosphoglycerate mutase [Candidatus Sumerlaeota bacterium]